MPIYEFHCRVCDSNFETLVRNSSEAVLCKQCGNDDLKKLISAHAVDLKYERPVIIPNPLSPSFRS